MITLADWMRTARLLNVPEAMAMEMWQDYCNHNPRQEAP